jgi:large subunit ribosomal protein L21
MYAVIETGGKQYRVEVGTELEVELLEAEPGQAITLERVLLIADGDEASVGRPVVADAAVEAEVLGRERGDKVIAFKYQPKARRRVKKGHRQELTRLRIADIRYRGRSAAELAHKAADEARTERQRLEEAAARQAAEDAALAAKLAASREVSEPKPETPKRTRVKSAEPGATAAPTKGARASRAKGAKAPAAKVAGETPADGAPAEAPGDAPGEATAAEPTSEITAPAPPKRSRAKKDE